MRSLTCMKRRKRVAHSAVIGHLVLLAGSALAGGPFSEDFDTLDGWEPLLFPKIETHSTYRIERTGDKSALRADSRASASGLVSVQTLDVYDHPELHWRWMVENIYENTQVQSKAGDDYRRAFGEEPPRVARIAIMNDSDNTGESAVSRIDWIHTKKRN